MNAEEAVVIDSTWEQAGALIACAWAIWGMVLLSWNTGTRFWSWNAERRSSRR
jgi:hypothetical protein